MRKVFVVSAALLLVVVLTIYAAYDSLFARKPYVGAIRQQITGDVWTPFNWQAGSDSSGEFVEGGFRARVVNGGSDFGAVGLEQGERAHGNGNADPLLMEVTVNRTGNVPLILNLTVDIESLKLYNFLSSTVNVGVVLFGDVGLNYSDPDLTGPHCGVIDFYYVVMRYWHGESWSPPESSEYDSDYRAGKVMVGPTILLGEYVFQDRVDDFVGSFLAHYDLQFFRIKLVQVYIEAMSGEGEIVIRRFVLGLA
jgi:hypothetical protein